tara:strand:+ start:35 stop:244 length:210 start_codon:yes stop_codon:yes gene_type:complete
MVKGINSINIPTRVIKEVENVLFTSSNSLLKSIERNLDNVPLIDMVITSINDVIDMEIGMREYVLMPSF